MKIIEVPWPFVAVIYTSLIGICAYLLWHDSNHPAPGKVLRLLGERIDVQPPQFSHFERMQFIPFLFGGQIGLLKLRYGLRMARSQCRYGLRVLLIKMLLMKNKFLLFCLKPGNVSALPQNIFPRLPNTEGESADRDGQRVNL